MTDKQIEDNEYWKKKYADIHIRLTNQIAELQEKLSAKEKECKRWKHQAELGLDTTNRLAKQLEEKEQEIDYCREKLHKQLDQLKKENEELKKAEEYDSCYNDMQAEIDCGNAIIDKYKQALTQIKELAESVTGCAPKCEICETDGYCVDCEEEILNQILQKCEVLKDE